VKHFVLDASVALAWFIDHPVAPYANRVKQLLLSGNRAVVPALWQLEVTNGFLVAERRGTIASLDISQALQSLEIMLLQVIDNNQEPVSMRRVLALARQFRLTAYDAAYLDTARDLQLPLATLDNRLAQAATEAGVQLLR
jgi:predicted nucleic acid-binding protein